jgi:hypothetical protein
MGHSVQYAYSAAANLAHICTGSDVLTVKTLAFRMLPGVNPVEVLARIVAASQTENRERAGIKMKSSMGAFQKLASK